MIGNTLTLRKFFLWNSQWFCDHNYYNLLFQDIKITNYLQSIFYFLKLPTSNIIIKRYWNKLIIQSNIHIMWLFNKHLKKYKLFFFFKRHQKYLINHFIFKKSVYFFYQKIPFMLYLYLYKKNTISLSIDNLFTINNTILTMGESEKNGLVIIDSNSTNIKKKNVQKNTSLDSLIINHKSTLKYISFLLTKEEIFKKLFKEKNSVLNIRYKIYRFLKDSLLELQKKFTSLKKYLLYLSKNKKTFLFEKNTSIKDDYNLISIYNNMIKKNSYLVNNVDTATLDLSENTKYIFLNDKYHFIKNEIYFFWRNTNFFIKNLLNNYLNKNNIKYKPFYFYLLVNLIQYNFNFTTLFFKNINSYNKFISFHNFSHTNILHLQMNQMNTFFYKKNYNALLYKYKKFFSRDLYFINNNLLLNKKYDLIDCFKENFFFNNESFVENKMNALFKQKSSNRNNFLICDSDFENIHISFKNFKYFYKTSFIYKKNFILIDNMNFITDDNDLNLSSPMYVCWYYYINKFTFSSQEDLLYECLSDLEEIPTDFFEKTFYKKFYKDFYNRTFFIKPFFFHNMINYNIYNLFLINKKIFKTHFSNMSYHIHYKKKLSKTFILKKIFYRSKNKNSISFFFISNLNMITKKGFKHIRNKFRILKYNKLKNVFFESSLFYFLISTINSIKSFDSFKSLLIKKICFSSFIKELHSNLNINRSKDKMFFFKYILFLNSNLINTFKEKISLQKKKINSYFFLKKKVSTNRSKNRSTSDTFNDTFNAAFDHLLKTIDQIKLPKKKEKMPNIYLNRKKHFYNKNTFYNKRKYSTYFDKKLKEKDRSISYMNNYFYYDTMESLIKTTGIHKKKIRRVPVFKRNKRYDPSHVNIYRHPFYTDNVETTFRSFHMNDYFKDSFNSYHFLNFFYSNRYEYLFFRKTNFFSTWKYLKILNSLFFLRNKMSYSYNNSLCKYFKLISLFIFNKIKKYSFFNKLPLFSIDSFFKSILDISNTSFYFIFSYFLNSIFSTYHLLSKSNFFFINNKFNFNRNILVKHKYKKIKSGIKKYFFFNDSRYYFGSFIKNRWYKNNDFFLLFYLKLYYIYNKNTLYKYSNNLFFYYLNNKKVSKLNVLKNNVFFYKKYFNHYLITNPSMKKSAKFVLFNALESDNFLYSNTSMKNIYNKKNNSSVLLYSSLLPFSSYFNHLFYRRICLNTFFKNKDNEKYIFYNFNINHFYSTNFLFNYWLLNKYFYSFLTFIIFIIKNLFFILLKKFYIYNIIFNFSNISFFFNQYSYLLNTVFNCNLIKKYFFFNNSILNYYYFNITYLNSINHLQNTILLYTLKNNSFHYYYVRYYILTFLYLFFHIELTISNYVKNNCFLFLTYSLNWTYYLNSAKMWCEYIIFQLKKKNTIRKLFWYIKKQQIREKEQMNYLYYTSEENKRKLIEYKYPLKGIRILYSGNFKKAKRKKKFNYYVWLTDIKFTGRMPLKQFKFYIDYYSSVAVLKRSSVGIKFWLLFNIY